MTRLGGECRPILELHRASDFRRRRRRAAQIAHKASDVLACSQCYYYYTTTTSLLVPVVTASDSESLSRMANFSLCKDESSESASTGLIHGVELATFNSTSRGSSLTAVASSTLSEDRPNSQVGSLAAIVGATGTKLLKAIKN